ncbi:MAG: hypothetical protein JEZ03_15440 [Bacteroidales bacterium]|nr:hypothetical protein [Bacteroidales bacterium]
MKEKIGILIEKYFQANTSLEEENILKEYFQGDFVADEYVQYGALFVSLSEQKKEKYHESVSINGNKTPIGSQERKILGMYPESFQFVSRIAAGLILLFGLYAGFNGLVFQQTDQIADTFDNPYEAYQATIKAMHKVVLYMDQGRQHTASLSAIENGMAKAESLKIISESFSIVKEDISPVQDGIEKAKRIAIWDRVNHLLRVR